MKKKAKSKYYNRIPKYLSDEEFYETYRVKVNKTVNKELNKARQKSGFTLRNSADKEDMVSSVWLRLYKYVPINARGYYTYIWRAIASGINDFLNETSDVIYNEVELFDNASLVKENVWEKIDYRLDSENIEDSISKLPSLEALIINMLYGFDDWKDKPLSKVLIAKKLRLKPRYINEKITNALSTLRSMYIRIRA